MRKVDAEAPHAVLLVLDATVGQNALSQVDAFLKTAGVTGLAITAEPGQVIAPPPDGASYLGFIFSRAAHPAAARPARHVKEG